MAGRRKIAVAAAAGLQVAALGLAAGVSSAAADSRGVSTTPGTACPAVYPVSQVTPGLTGTGLTVSSGTTPSPFTVTVLGVLKNGIAPGVDMIMVKADSPAISAAGGIWAGMSGSPVYAPDGRLLGAIAYGLSTGPSNVAGVTPAGAMQSATSASAVDKAKARVALPTRLQSRLVADGAVSKQAASSGMRRLAVPLSVSGVSSDRLDRLAHTLGAHAAASLVPYAGSASGAAAAPAGSIVAGGNLAAAVSYGDITAAAFGTATTVCGNKVLGFGHPFTFQGKTAFSAQAASTVYVQNDPVFGPFAVANLTGSVGTLDQDRLTAVRATLGAGPTVIPVTTQTSASNGSSRTGKTYVAGNTYLPDISFAQVFSNLDVTLQREGAGSAALTWTVTGRTSSGPFTLTRTTRVADLADISSATGFDMASALAQLTNNRFAAPTITGVKAQINADEQYRAYAMDALLLRRGGRWVSLGDNPSVSVRPGAQITLRAVLTPYQGRGHVRNVDVKVTVPKRFAGQTGDLQITGGVSADVPDPGTAHSFNGLLAVMRTQPRYDTLRSTLSFMPGSTVLVAAHGQQILDQVVTGSTDIMVQVARR